MTANWKGKCGLHRCKVLSFRLSVSLRHFLLPPLSVGEAKPLHDSEGGANKWLRAQVLVCTCSAQGRHETDAPRCSVFR